MIYNVPWELMEVNHHHDGVNFIVGFNEQTDWPTFANH